MINQDYFAELCRKYGLKTDISLIQYPDDEQTGTIAYIDVKRALMCSYIENDKYYIMVFNGEGKLRRSKKTIEKELVAEIIKRKKELVAAKKEELKGDFV
jgi:hypothetical protein